MFPLNNEQGIRRMRSGNGFAVGSFFFSFFRRFLRSFLIQLSLIRFEVVLVIGHDGIEMWTTSTHISFDYTTLLKIHNFFSSVLFLFFIVFFYSFFVYSFLVF